MIAWDGSLEASHALRLTLPMLKQASAVHVVTIAQGHREFPATDASHYLARHGIASELHESRRRAAAPPRRCSPPPPRCQRPGW